MENNDIGDYIEENNETDKNDENADDAEKGDNTDENNDSDNKKKTDEKDDNADKDDKTGEKDDLVCNTRRLAPSSQRPRITHQNVFTWQQNTSLGGIKLMQKESEEKIWTELSEKKEQEIVGIEKWRVVRVGEKEK